MSFFILIIMLRKKPELKIKWGELIPWNRYFIDCMIPDTLWSGLFRVRYDRYQRKAGLSPEESESSVAQ